jgi:hypothetical protein
MLPADNRATAPSATKVNTTVLRLGDPCNHLIGNPASFMVAHPAFTLRIVMQLYTTIDAGRRMLNGQLGVP